MKLAINPDSISIFVGDTIDLTANKMVSSWSTSNAAVATVSSTGKVAGIAEGRAVITATAGSEGATSVVLVRKRPEVQSISMALTSYHGKVGDQLFPAVTVVADSGVDKRFRCGSDNAAVATGDTTRVNGVLVGWFKLVSVSPLNGTSPVQVWCETLQTHTFPNGTKDRLKTGGQVFVAPK
jgi:uncharacterized protein YjdB